MPSTTTVDPASLIATDMTCAHLLLNYTLIALAFIRGQIRRGILRIDL